MSRKQIVRLAIRLADKNGVENLSMRKLAVAAKVEAMSLYNHISGKDDLLDAMLERVVGLFAVPSDSDNWIDEIRVVSLSMHQILLRHPWAAPMMFSRVRIDQASLQHSEAIIACLKEAGFSYPMADHAWNAIENHIYGFTLRRIGTPVEPKEYAAAAEKYLPLIPVHKYPHLNAMATLIADGKHTGINDYEFGLNLILDGLAGLLE